ncbi:MAG: FtsQ-type POTRA domain-containing protein [Verrucomicrobia bacterium]|nr:FtsQ-type POTRA domain-containing protein [Verrucomicrobiota bacterium]NDB99940.1 FtsQ-type POTRA domain-containing protein [Verrucomicrobiota bacterium]NDF16729.1 FtsQ-type POTRA domain-containing protein [Verrucomicrobiota bacterium]
MKIQPLTRWVARRRPRSRRARHVLHTKMNGRAQAREFSRRVGICILVAASLAMAALVTSIGMDAILGRLLYQNPDFMLRRFEIEQQGRIGKGELVQASGVKIGQNLLGLSLQEVAANLHRLPNVASVRIERRLPDTLYIFVEERRPVALVCPTPTAGTTLAQATYYIDARGHLIKPKPGEKLMSLPIIRGIPSEEVVEGEKTNNPELYAVLAFLQEASLAQIRDQLDVSAVRIEGPGRFLVSTPRGGSIRFRTGHLGEQFERLGVIFTYAENQGRLVRTVDLTPERNVPVTFLN